MEAGAVDAALIEARYNVMLDRKSFCNFLFVGDLIPSPLANVGTRLDRIQKQPLKIQCMVRATLRGIHLAKKRPLDDEIGGLGAGTGRGQLRHDRVRLVE